MREPKDFLVVGIGASAGGLDACQKLVDALPVASGMAFILVQHLDPTHESMMVDLLADRTAMRVQQAVDGMPILRDNIYVIPPGTYLSVGDRALLLSRPKERHGARLPFDFLLHSLAKEYGHRAIGVVLSGTGADGTLGFKAVKEKGGLVIAQDPDEADYDGMPKSAILSGAVDHVLAVAKIPAALARYERRMRLTGMGAARAQDGVPDFLPDIVALMGRKTPHDFGLYKEGTLRRRIERRMAMAGIDGMDRYLELLQKESGELDLLAKDLLINVTGFFRDRHVFEFVSREIIPGLVRDRAPDQPLRIWIAGCSTGEETYSLAMLFLEEIAAANRNVKLQVFASDVDPDAIASAREGLYPQTIEDEVSPERLARFFIKENKTYRVLPELRSTVVFTVQDVLVDPPFSRIDLVSCRNLLIYLRPEAQARVISLFHFSLREGGVLVLGNSETAGNGDERFEVISKAERIYRHVGRSRPGEIGFSIGAGSQARLPASPQPGQSFPRHAALAELCQRLVMESYAPAAVLINRDYQSLYSIGPTDRYLQVAPGYATHDLLAMTRASMRTKLRLAIRQASKQNTRILVAGGRLSEDDHSRSFSIAVQPVLHEGEELLLICFVDDPSPERRRGRPSSPREAPRIAELEHELEATRSELSAAIRDLERSAEEQKAINEEALSVNEEYQSANEELLTSKEELQSLNEELTALNSQLQETLERQRTTANDLQNVLYSTDVATLFLDPKLNIRFFTPATRSLFSVIPSDVGRPLADLSSLVDDPALLTDTQAVLTTLTPVEREIEGRGGSWYVRRILPYRTQNDEVEGVVITFTDSTERKRTAEALEAAKLQAELATIAKSRFLAAASHDLRQPLQTLNLLQGMLSQAVEGEKAQTLVAWLDRTLGAMSGMLNTLLDINQIEGGAVRVEATDFPINDLLDRLKGGFSHHAEARSLTLRVVPCGASIHSDPRLLEQMVRNLLSNALKYTMRGKVLLGCRRRKGALSIEVWDTGIGIPDQELQTIFEEYHRLDNAASEHSHGLGLGLSIVQRLGNLLNHQVRVRSQPGKGSVFAIEVSQSETSPRLERDRRGTDQGIVEHVRNVGEILLVEDDPGVRELLELALTGEGHHILTAPDGVAALKLVARGALQTDLALLDYNLPGGMNGLQLMARLREKLRRDLPVIILTGDISSSALRDIGRGNCTYLTKPVKLPELTELIQSLLPGKHPRTRQPAEAVRGPGPSVIFVVDDDSHIRKGLRAVLEDNGFAVEDFATCEAFLEVFHPGGEACLLIDACLPGISGLDLLRQLRDSGHMPPSIMITGNGDVQMAVHAMQAGASDFLEKPVSRDELLESIERALRQPRDSKGLIAWREAAANHLAGLTPRQLQIMQLVLAGHPNKNIAADLGISQRTVENHRAAIMKKTGSKSLPALARLAMAAGY
jgi:two-component system CheB/CheR fusion protein